MRVRPVRSTKSRRPGQTLRVETRGCKSAWGNKEARKQDGRRCYRCKKVGHLKHNCPMGQICPNQQSTERKSGGRMKDEANTARCSNAQYLGEVKNAWREVPVLLAHVTQPTLWKLRRPRREKVSFLRFGCLRLYDVESRLASKCQSDTGQTYCTWRWSNDTRPPQWYPRIAYLSGTLVLRTLTGERGQYEMALAIRTFFYASDSRCNLLSCSNLYDHRYMINFGKGQCNGILQDTTQFVGRNVEGVKEVVTPPIPPASNAVFAKFVALERGKTETERGRSSLGTNNSVTLMQRLSWTYLGAVRGLGMRPKYAEDLHATAH